MTLLLLRLWLGKALALARAHPMACLCLLLACYGLWERHQHIGWRDYAKRLEAASAGATKAQIATNRVTAAKSQAIAEKSNAEAPAYYRSVHDAADRHAVRVRAPASGPSNSGVPGADPVEPGVHGPDPAPELVCRPAVEDSQIVGAAARGAEMHQEALDLIAEGVAVPADQ